MQFALHPFARNAWCNARNALGAEAWTPARVHPPRVALTMPTPGQRAADAAPAGAGRPQTAPSYLTYCLEAATGTLPTGVCAEGTYAIINAVLTQALTDPAGLNETLLDPLAAICQAGCVTQLTNMVRSAASRRNLARALRAAASPAATHASFLAWRS